MTNAETNDAFQQAAAGAVGDHLVLKQMRSLAEEAVSLQAQVEQMEEATKQLKQQLNDIRHQKLPDMMAAAQLTQFKLDDGTVIKIDDFCSGSLPKEDEKRKAAIAWLIANEAASLIKTEVEVSFDRQQHKRALAIAQELKDKGCNVAVAEGVHPKTLQAFAQERLRNGETIDTEVLGLYVGRVAKITLPKAKTQKA